MSTVRCAICGDLLPIDDVTCVECSHAFHNHCITQFLIRPGTCPQCRQPIKQLTKIFFSESDGPNIEVITETCKKNIVLNSIQLKLHKEKLHQLISTKRMKEMQQEYFMALSNELILYKNIQQIIDNRTKDIHKIILHYKNLEVIRAFATLITIEGKASLAKEKKKTEEIEKNLKKAYTVQMKVGIKLTSFKAKIQDNRTKIAELENKLVSHPLIVKPPNTAGSQSKQVKTNKRMKNTKAPRM